jgi:hypothetical protein
MGKAGKRKGVRALKSSKKGKGKGGKGTRGKGKGKGKGACV